MTSGDGYYATPTTCGTFPTYAPSALEQDLGQPTINMTPVCYVSGANILVNSAYAGMTNTQIAMKESPYFIQVGTPSSAYADLFAQEFAIAVGINSSAAAPSSTPEAGPALPFINQVIRSGATFCSLGTLENYRAGRFPHNVDPHCPPTVDADFTHQ